MIGAIIRFVVSALVLMFVGWITPGVNVNGFWGALFASLVIAGLGWLIQATLGRGASPQSRGIIGFVAATVVILLTSALFPQWIQVTWWGAALAAIVIALVDAVVPTELR
jgi:putative membrane protein